MAFTLKESLQYVPDGSFLDELTRESAFLADLRRKDAEFWAALPWRRKAGIRARSWIRAHTPHLHIYLGEHPRDEDDY